ncbi:MAG: fumarate hydratase [Lachnospiraceae bacterium]|nr:fumarate hydratase [Lachnospiraceae bacterium]
MLREVELSRITQVVRDLCIEANLKLSPDMEKAVREAAGKERNPLGVQILARLGENLDIAGREEIPICQDTGMAVVFVELGQDVHLTGGDLTDAVNEGVRRGYTEGYLRKSVVKDPLRRENTGDNTPAVLHVKIVQGENVRITVAPKGFGSENMSRLFMLKPADGEDGVMEAVVGAVRDAGPNACPPVVVGVGIGGTVEKCTLLAKEALLVPTGRRSEKEHIARMETELLARINALGIGPAGLGGDVTALDLHIKTFPTHIAGLPVAVNMCCHVNRHASAVV